MQSVTSVLYLGDGVHISSHQLAVRLAPPHHTHLRRPGRPLTSLSSSQTIDGAERGVSSCYDGVSVIRVASIIIQNPGLYIEN